MASAREDLEDATDALGVRPFYLRLENPIRMPDLPTWAPADVKRELVEQGIISEHQADAADIVDNEQFAEWLEAAGFDGVIYDNQTEGEGESYIVLDNSQILPATVPAFSLGYSRMLDKLVRDVLSLARSPR